MTRSPYNLAVTLSLAQEEFAKQSPQRMAENSGCSYDETTKSFTVPYLMQNYSVTYPQGNVTNTEQKEADLTTAILILHYLTGASGVELTNDWVSFKELQGGAIYIQAFQKRAINPLVQAFGKEPDAFTAATKQFAGTPAEFGDLSYIIPVFPRIPILLILWRGDDEFPPNGTILFDRNANTYLHTEDFAHLASMTVYALIKTLKK